MQLSDTALRRLGWALLALFAVGVAVGGTVEALDPQHYSSWGAGGLGSAIFIGMTGLFPVVAQLIVRQQPRNRIGWLLHGIGLGWTVTNLADAYVTVTLVVRPGSLPGGDIAELVDSMTWVPPIVLIGVFVLLLFPDGRPASPRWRVVGWVAAVNGVLLILAVLLAPGPVPEVRVPLSENPLGVGVAGSLISGSRNVFLAAVPLTIAVAAAGMVVKFRRAQGVQRLQLRWLVAAGAAIAAISSAGSRRRRGGLGRPRR